MCRVVWRVLVSSACHYACILVGSLWELRGFPRACCKTDVRTDGRHMGLSIQFEGNEPSLILDPKP